MEFNAIASSSLPTTNPRWIDTRTGAVFDPDQWTPLQQMSQTTTYRMPSWETAKLPCPSKLEGQNRPWAAEFFQKWEKAKELGLTSEMRMIEKDLLKKDIEALTAGVGYIEVFPEDLEALFDFPRLRRKIFWHNVKANLPFSKREKIVLRLSSDPAHLSQVPIPYGAMLRMEEARSMGIFTEFRVYYPNVVTESELAREKAREMDPALVGIVAGAIYLICSWDLPKDVHKAEATIDALLAAKIPA